MLRLRSARTAKSLGAITPAHILHAPSSVSEHIWVAITVGSSGPKLAEQFKFRTLSIGLYAGINP